MWSSAEWVNERCTSSRAGSIAFQLYTFLNTFQSGSEVLTRGLTR